MKPCFTASDPAYAPDWALFLDVDGTLLGFQDHPCKVAVPGDVRTLLRRLHELQDGALALVSGRPLDDVDRLFAPLRLCVAGQHGVERRDGQGRVHRHTPDPGSLARLHARIAAAVAPLRGVWTERKPAGSAVHFRGAPGHSAAVGLALARVVDEMAPAFVLQPGKMVLEVLPSGRNKGVAIDEFMAEPPFAGRRPVYIGDDITDEHAFRRINARAGVSIKVGFGDTAAQLRLADPAAVLDWLDGYVQYREQVPRRQPEHRRG